MNFPTPVSTSPEFEGEVQTAKVKNKEMKNHPNLSKPKFCLAPLKIY